MPGIADLLYLGQPDPARQIAQMLSGQQPPPPGGQGAGPQGPNPPAPNGPAPAQPGQPQQLTPGQQTPPGPGSQPQPMAYQSSPDMQSSYQQLAQPPNLMSLYLQLQARDRAEDQMNRGFALIAANHAGNPEMARAIMQSVSGGGGNAGGTVGDLMSLYNTQQQMAGQQAMLGEADALDAKLGYPPGTSRAMILSGRGSELIQDLKPTDLARNYEWARDTFKKNNPNASEAEVEAGAQSILLGAGGGGAVGSELRSMNLARSQWLANPDNKGKDPPGYMTDEGKWKIYQADLSDARTQFGGVNSSLDKFVGDLSDVSNDPELDGMAGHPWSAGLGTTVNPTGAQAQTLKRMNTLAEEAKDMASRGGPKGVNQNLKTIGSDSDALKDLTVTDYRGDVIAPRMKQALTAQANARGAAGLANANDTPGYLQHYMDQMYKPGGELDIGGSPKTLTPDTGPDGKPLKPPDAAALRDFYTALEHRGPKYALDGLKNAGYDTSALR